MQRLYKRQVGGPRVLHRRDKRGLDNIRCARKRIQQRREQLPEQRKKSRMQNRRA